MTSSREILAARKEQINSDILRPFHNEQTRLYEEIDYWRTEVAKNEREGQPEKCPLGDWHKTYRYDWEPRDAQFADELQAISGHLQNGIKEIDRAVKNSQNLKELDTNVIASINKIKKSLHPGCWDLFCLIFDKGFRSLTAGLPTCFYNFKTLSVLLTAEAIMNQPTTNDTLTMSKSSSGLFAKPMEKNSETEEKPTLTPKKQAFS